jgi:diguanylate cyclase (GGDEF)-like protein
VRERSEAESEEQLLRLGRAVSRANGHFSVMIDRNFQIEWASETAYLIFGWPTLVGRNMTELVHPEDFELAAQSIEFHVDHAADYQANFDPAWRPDSTSIRIATAEGDYIRADVQLCNFLDDPEIGGLLGLGRFGRDLSDLATAIDLLGQSASLDSVLPVLARLVDCSVDGTRTQIVFWQDGATTAHTAPDSEELPLAPIDLLHLARDTGQVQQILDLQGHPTKVQTEKFGAVSLLPVALPGSEEVGACIVLWSEPAMGLISGPQRLIHQAVRLTALAVADHRAKEALRFDAQHDGLTGLLNRKGLSKAFAAQQDPVAVLYIDLDDFKPVNDEYGHEVGDLVLVEIARRINESVREIDFVARLGGDEFAVLCPGITDPSEATDIAERLISAVAQLKNIGEFRGKIGASAGVSLGDCTSDPAALLRSADVALYQAKAGGKQRVAVHTSPKITLG